jgi:acetate kinase
VIIDEDVKEKIYDAVSLIPLHGPAFVLCLEAVNHILPNVTQVATFDTAFHQTMPKEAFLYALPIEQYENYRIRKYGFHGTSHAYIAQRTEKFLGKKGKYISCHLGNGASITAIDNGKSVDTTMGFTPLEGLVMGTRSGDIDPAVLEFVMNKTGMSIEEMLNALNKKSGLLGLSQLSNDMRDVAKAAKEGDEKSKLAINKFVHVVKKYIGSYAAIMNGVDAIAFSAGTGENRDDIREQIMTGLDYLGVDFDYEANTNFERGVNYKISKDSSKVAVYVIPTDEEMSIARQAKAIVEK